MSNQTQTLKAELLVHFMAGTDLTPEGKAALDRAFAFVVTITDCRS